MKSTSARVLQAADRTGRNIARALDDHESAAAVEWLEETFREAERDVASRGISGREGAWVLQGVVGFEDDVYIRPLVELLPDIVPSKRKGAMWPTPHPSQDLDQLSAYGPDMGQLLDSGALHGKVDW